MLYVYLDAFHCHQETNDGVSASDEPYIIVASIDLAATVAIGGFSAPIPASRTFRYGPFRNVDAKETKYQFFHPFWGLFGEGPLQNPTNAIFIVSLMESDDGNAEALRGLIAQAVNSALFASLNVTDPQTRANLVLQAVDAAMNIPTGFPDVDDKIGGPQQLRFSAADIALAETGNAAQVNLRFVGDGGHSTLMFKARNRGQNAWRHCGKCRSLFFDGFQAKGYALRAARTWQLAGLSICLTNTRGQWEVNPTGAFVTAVFQCFGQATSRTKGNAPPEDRTMLRGTIFTFRMTTAERANPIGGSAINVVLCFGVANLTKAYVLLEGGTMSRASILNSTTSRDAARARMI
ncbi:hypothetical protein GF108_14470 [Phyllobacterium sp. SYP-B3895]|uniref:hypothetical protein n=1 Tax=Phyllobacterium sp. SYP-B3895 TaxID=2663240 RepID=UPI0012995E66|nr:hypothetical protein [Phyllobacterium sp. SYP-B3895]MRG56781.1 hypothetical protein [Phyllobacterium sp. SYP-B3895]